MYTAFGVNDANAVKVWGKGVQVAIREKAEIGRMMGKSDDSIVQIKTETQKGKGDQVKFNLRTCLSGDGFTEGQRATGNGEALSFFQTSILINELGNVASPTSEFTIDAQRVPFEPRNEGKSALTEWWARRIAVTAFNHWCGYLPANNAPYGVKYTGNNVVTASTSTRRVWATATVTTDETLGSGDKANLNMIDRALTASCLGENMMRPAMIGGSPKFVAYFHPQQAEDLTTSASTGQWFSIQQAALQGGMITKNAIFTGALGEYKGVVLRKTQDVTLGVNSTTGASVANVRKAVLLGAQAGVTAHTKKGNPGDNKYRWTEKYDDHERVFEMGAWGIWGFSKPVYSGQVDQGVVAMSSYSSQ